jgi:hypothetical protein
VGLCACSTVKLAAALYSCFAGDAILIKQLFGRRTNYALDGLAAGEFVRRLFIHLSDLGESDLMTACVVPGLRKRKKPRS